MNIYEAMGKTSPVPYKKRKENESNFKKMVDRNTELVDEKKELERELDELSKAYNNLSKYYQVVVERKKLMKTRIDKAIEYLLDKYVKGLLNDDEVNNVVKILKGEE